MVEIHWTDEAQVWLKDIHSYIAQDNKKVASRVINEIFNKTQILSSFPKIGYQYKHGSLEIERYL